jgi:large subunit ribosomal protein L10
VKREIKEQRVKELSGQFRGSRSFYLLDYQNMTVAQSVELRNILRKNSYSIKVAKNRLALRALREDCPGALKAYFRKPTAIAFAVDNPVGLAQLIRDYSAQNKVLTVKGGMVEGQMFSGERFEEVSRLTSREDLLGKMANLMAFPLKRLLRTWQAPLTQLGSLLSQLKIQK